MTEVDLFTQFWSAYPKDLCHKRKGGLPVARTSWEKMKNDAGVVMNDDEKQHVLICMREMMRYDRGLLKRGEKVDRWPHASTFLNQERWRGIEDIRPGDNHGNRPDMCACGAPTGITNQCWDCYKRDNPGNDFDLKGEFIKNELMHNESTAERKERCKDWLRQKGYLGTIIPE